MLLNVVQISVYDKTNTIICFTLFVIDNRLSSYYKIMNIFHSAMLGYLAKPVLYDIMMLRYQTIYYIFCTSSIIYMALKY